MNAQKVIVLTIIALVIFKLSGCQELSEIEYYDQLHPETREQLIKREMRKKGVPDWSEGKQFNINANKL